MNGISTIEERYFRKVYLSCLRKSRYESEKCARTAANLVWKERRIALRLYQCPHCVGFHLTKQVRNLDSNENQKKKTKPKETFELKRYLRLVDFEEDLVV